MTKTSNFYKNNGYYNAVVNASFAKLINENEFELVFNIDAKTKIYFGELKLNLQQTLIVTILKKYTVSLIKLVVNYIL